MYLVTSKYKHSGYTLFYVDKFFKKDRAIACYKELKKDGLKDVKLSLVLKLNK